MSESHGPPGPVSRWLVAAGVLIGILIPELLFDQPAPPQEEFVKETPKPPVEKPIEKVAEKSFERIETFSLQPSPKNAQNVAVYGNPNDEVRGILGGFGATFLEQLGGYAR